MNDTDLAKLTARTVPDTDGDLVEVLFGNEVVAQLVPEEGASIEDTVAPVLRHIFDKALTDLGYE
jgi:hypothetical protein